MEESGFNLQFECWHIPARVEICHKILSNQYSNALQIYILVTIFFRSSCNRFAKILLGWSWMPQKARTISVHILTGLRVISIRNVCPIDSSKPWHHIHNPCPPAMCVCIMAPSRPVHHLLDVNIPSLCQLSHSPILPFNFAYPPLKILEYTSLAKFRVNILERVKGLLMLSAEIGNILSSFVLVLV